MQLVEITKHAIILGVGEAKTYPSLVKLLDFLNAYVNIMVFYCENPFFKQHTTLTCQDIINTIVFCLVF